jgi:uncharacterized protein YkwD
MTGVAISLLALALTQAAVPERPLVPRPPTVPGNGSSSSESAAEQELLALANQARAQAGLAPLRVDDCLTRAARQHAAVMAARAQISHQFSGEPPLTRRVADNCRSPLDQYAENVAEAGDAQGAHDSFMHSPSHRDNLLHPAYNVAGFGIVRRGSMLYVVQDFGHSLPSYSTTHAADLMASSINRARRDAGLSDLEKMDSSAAQSEACALAQSDSLRPAAPAKPGQARYILRFTAMEVDNLPAAADKALRDRTLRSFELGVCFARSASYPNGAYWVVLQLR